MISLLISFAVLIVGFLVYGRVTERIFGPDDRPTHAVAINDGVDCVPLKTWKAFLVQLLNIAGTGPIFGALMGAVFGPVVFLLTAPEGFRLDHTVSRGAGTAAAAVLFAVYLVLAFRRREKA